MIEINQQRLRYFYEVCIRGKIRSAADSLNISASVITRQIKLLEEEIGFKLFERRPHGVVPTDAAELLLEYYRHNRDAQVDFEMGLQELRDMRRGTIRLAMPATFVSALMSVFNDFRQQYPNINLHIEEIFESIQIVNQILEDISHIGVVHVCPNYADLHYYARVPLPLYMLVSKNYPLAHQHKITFAEAIRYPLSLPASGVLPQMVQSVARAEKIEFPTPVFVSNSTTARKEFACAGSGVIFMSIFSARKEIEAGELIALEIDHPVFKSTDLSLVTRRGKPLLPATEELLNLLSAHLSIFTFEPQLSAPLTTMSGASHE